MFAALLFTTKKHVSTHFGRSWSLWKYIVSRSTAELSTPISTVVVLCSRANLLCLVNLATDILTGCIYSFMAVIVGQTNCLKLETHVASAQDIML